MSPPGRGRDLEGLSKNPNRTVNLNSGLKEIVMTLKGPLKSALTTGK